MSLRSMGVEFPVDNDPTKLHGLVGPDGPFFRAECMACGYRSTPYLAASSARGRAVRHANSESHRVQLRREQEAPGV